MRRQLRLTVSLFSLLAVAGCVPAILGERRHEPLVIGAPAYQTETNGKITLNGPWYEQFNDPTLNTLIQRGFAENLTLTQAIARLDAANAQAHISRTNVLPKVNATADLNQVWNEGDRQDLTSRYGGALQWELDLFGRLSSAAKADRLSAVAAAEDVETTRLTLAADIAVAYYNAVAAHRTLSLLDAQNTIDNDILSLIELREREGLGTQVEVLQQQSQQALTRSLVPVAQSNLRVYENRLDVLTGNMPDALDVTTRESAFPPSALTPPTGIPSDLLLNRPDLRAARARLRAADADIDEAIANQLPRVTLTGSFLFASGGNAASPVLSLLGGLVQPLLDWGQRQADVKRNKALYREQLAGFSQLYLEAVEDVETTLYQITKQKEYMDRLEDRRRILADTTEKTRAVYTEGLSDYLPVLNALQSLRAIERTILEEERDLALLHIQLYRALGGTPATQETPS